MSLPIISADDWGMSRGINEGILDLAQRGIVRRVSILASASFVSHGLDELKTVPALTLGLHLSLTFGETRLRSRIRNLAVDGKFHLSPARILLLYLLSNPDKQESLSEEVNLLLREQIEILAYHGVRPAYLDGHHYVHQVPGIMESILPILREFGISQVRVSWDPARLLSRVGPAVLLAIRARQKWRRWGLTFLPFVCPSEKDYREKEHLRRIMVCKGGHEMVVHPAARDDVLELNIPDRYPGDRVREFQILCSLESLFSSQSHLFSKSSR